MVIDIWFVISFMNSYPILFIMDQYEKLWENIKMVIFVFLNYAEMQDSFIDILKLLLPEIIVEYFELTSYEKGEERLHLYLKEINSIPKEYHEAKLSSKGFFDQITVQDFSIRGHQVYLHITSRRWLNEDTGKIVFRDWNLVANGTHVTSEFASFLKEINRFQAK
ncbi:hypothetical protein QLS31_16135 [Flavobacterium sp. XS2P24]|uniref:ISAon1 family transposase N-terminal region protein n=1 Tax=Flavobacterium sp. XS2P24 TaxID=3041249 RepID=UPI0024A7E051|nr:hypothetical protein [Flavobacterium sp. XS2P24]MDI6051355.1 hypothetical protein [Flavobacterium sp. XS2P24]